MLILIYSHSDDFLSQHEYAITAEGHECLCARSDDEATNLARTRPVDIIYLHASSIGIEIEHFMFVLNAFKGSMIFSCIDLDIPVQFDTKHIEGIDDVIFTSNDDPRPFISRLHHLYSETQDTRIAMHYASLKQASLQTYVINDASFNWSFTCHADIKAINKGDILERITRTSQFFQIPTEHHRNVLIILTELYNNAIDHGILGLPSIIKQDMDGFAKFYELRLTQLSKLETGSIDIKLEQKIIDNKTELSVSIKDSGKGFDFNKQLNKESAITPYGRGLVIIDKLAKSVEFKGNGNEVEVIYAWPI